MGHTTIISIVNTDVVVLCEYLPQEFPFGGLLKVIVLYCNKFDTLLQITIIYSYNLSAACLALIFRNHILPVFGAPNGPGSSRYAGCLPGLSM